MNEWIVPLAGLLIYLFFCPGCFVWVWLYNRNAEARARKVRTVKTVPVGKLIHCTGGNA